MMADNENAAKGNEIRELPLRLINKHKTKDTSKIRKGTLKFLYNTFLEVFPQTNRGPTPVRNSNIKPIGMLILL